MLLKIGQFISVQNAQVEPSGGCTRMMSRIIWHQKGMQRIHTRKEYSESTKDIICSASNVLEHQR